MAGFVRRGVTKYRWATAVANVAAPTRAEVDAAVNLGGNLADLTGLTSTRTTVDRPDMDNKFTKKVAGVDEVPDIAFTFQDDNDATTAGIRAALAEGTDGYLLVLTYGDVPTKRMEVWPCQTLAVNDQHTAANETAKFMVGFAPTDTPTKDAVVPAAA